jgi:3-deoxy-D-manno-octulosonic acid kinase
MTASTAAPDHAHLLCDESQTPEISSHHFEPDWWRARDAVIATAAGRGPVCFVQAGAEVWVLRHYRRGGWAARFSRDRYLWTGLAATRPWREWRLTRRLRELGLPVPVAVAARVIRHGLTWSGDLITRRIDNTETLAAILRERALPAADWRHLGGMLRRFHDAGVRHDDINVSNILRSTGDGAFHMIDFDKAALAAPGAWRERNLARFRRSLDKQRRLAPSFAFTDADWSALLSGYQEPRRP